MTGAQQDRHRFPGLLGAVIDERTTGETRSPLIGWGRELLIGMSGHQRGVQIDDQWMFGISVVIRRPIPGGRLRLSTHTPSAHLLVTALTRLQPD